MHKMTQLNRNLETTLYRYSLLHKVKQKYMYFEVNKTGTSKVGAITKAQKAQKIFFEKK